MRLGGKSLEFLSGLLWVGAASYSPAMARMVSREPLGTIRPHQLRRWEEKRWIIRRKDERTSNWIVTLTQEGRQFIGGGKDVENIIRTPWDGKWRVVTFDIPRDQGNLRRKLIEWFRANEFTLLQGSVWISPWPLEATLPQAEKGLASPLNVFPFETEKIFGLNHVDIVENAWDWDDINARHKIYRSHLRNKPHQGSSSDIWKPWLAEEQEQWRNILRQEALLPTDLQPSTYPMSHTIRLRNRKIKAPGNITLK
jgi:DNA-binding transcriptional regulator PaaX